MNHFFSRGAKSLDRKWVLDPFDQATAKANVALTSKTTANGIRVCLGAPRMVRKQIL
jgi:hypothetical protein